MLGLKNMTTYGRVKSATAGPVCYDTYLGCLFYFVLESEEKA